MKQQQRKIRRPKIKFTPNMKMEQDTEEDEEIEMINTHRYNNRHNNRIITDS